MLLKTLFFILFVQFLPTLSLAQINNDTNPNPTLLKQGQLASIEQAQGQVITATLVNQSILNQDVIDQKTTDDVMVVNTGEESSTSIKRADGSLINVEQKTVLILNPTTEIIPADPQEQKESLHSVNLIWGKITTSIDCNNIKRFEVRSSLADVIAKNYCNTQNENSYANPIIQFSTQYKKAKSLNARNPNNIRLGSRVDNTSTSITGFTNTFNSATEAEINHPDNSSLVVSVISGSVEVIDRKTAIPVTLNSGEEFIIAHRVPHPAWVLPINDDIIYGGQENLLSWTAYPGASGYMIEYNIPTPVFAEDNATHVEFDTQLIRLLPSDYEDFNGLILYRITLATVLSNTPIEARIFALDLNGEIISESVSSDRTSIIWQ